MTVTLGDLNNRSDLIIRPVQLTFRLQLGSDQTHFVCLRFCDQKKNQVISSKRLAWSRRD